MGKLLNILMILASLVLSLSQPQALQADEFESYESRPKIEDVKTNNKNSKYSNYVKSFYLSSYLLYHSYPKDTEFIFLARDAEYMYDMARLVFPDKEKNRLHLLSISTILSLDSNLKTFLEERGFDEKEVVKNNKRIVFVDTGFMGTVPEQIYTHFSTKWRKNTDVFLLESNSSRYSTKKSITDLVDVGAMENLSHYNSTALGLKRINGELWEVSKTNSQNNRTNALQIMADTRELVESHDLKEHLIGAEHTQKNWTISFGKLSKIAKDIERTKLDCVFCQKSEKHFEELQNLLKAPKEKIAETASIKRLIYLVPRNLDKVEPKVLSNVFKYIIKNSSYIVAYENYEIYEDFLLSMLPALLAEKDVAALRLAIKYSVKLDAEETLEKIIPRIGMLPTKNIKELEKDIIKIIEKADRIFESPRNLAKALHAGLLPKIDLNQFKDLKKSYNDFVKQDAELLKKLESYDIQGAQCKNVI